MTVGEFIHAIQQYQLSAEERVQLFALAMLTLFSLAYIVITHRISRKG